MEKGYMSRAKSPRAAARSLGFDPEKIRAFGKACRLARNYFNGGIPPEGAESWEDDPNYQSGWGLKLADVQFFTGVPISSISEVENHASYTIGFDTAASLAAWYYGNSKNKALLTPWMGILGAAETFLSPNEELVQRTQVANSRDAISVVDEVKNDILLRGENPVDRPPVSQALIDSVEYLIREYARLIEAPEESAIRASRLPVAELNRLRAWLSQKGEAIAEEEAVAKHDEYREFWQLYDAYADGFGKDLDKEDLVVKISQDISVEEDLVRVLVYSDDAEYCDQFDYDDPVQHFLDRWKYHNIRRLMAVLKDPETGKGITHKRMEEVLGVKLNAPRAKKTRANS